MKNWKLPDYKKRQEELAIDYSHYHFTAGEWGLVLLEGMLLLGLIGYCFYDSFWVCICLSPGLVFFFKYMEKKMGEKQRQTLRLQFKDAVIAVSVNQKAGYSVENAFKEAYSDMKMLYGENSLICRELLYLIRGISNNITIEKLLLYLGDRSEISDIREFGEIFAIAKRSGGNLSQVIEMTATTIEEKIDVEQEIKVMISAKQMEANIMSVIPFMIILYMDATSDGFFDVLYHNALGVIIMTVCLSVYIISFLLMQKIINIHV